MKHAEYNGESSPDSPFAITVSFILEMLARDFRDADGLLDRLRDINKRIKSGPAPSVRRLELQLLQAGKCSTSPATFFDKFVARVRDLCDPLYAKHEPAESQRSAYYGHDITLMEHIITVLSWDSTNLPCEEEDPIMKLFASLTPGLADASRSQAATPVVKTSVPPHAAYATTSSPPPVPPRDPAGRAEG